VLRFLRRVAENAYVHALSGPQGQRVNTAVLRMALHARGYGYGGRIEATGEAAFIDRLADCTGLCVDVGANRGEYSEALLRKTRATVIAFEPHPETFKTLASLEARYPGRAVCVNRGVADVAGELELHWGENSELASFSTEVLSIGYVGACNVHRTVVPVTTVDEFFAGEGRRFDGTPLTLLKVDTEGFEDEVLRGARETLEHRRPKFVQIEFNRHQLLRGQTLYSIAKHLEGYRPHQILHGARGLHAVAADDPLSNFFDYANFVFVRPDVRL
jgi:FkbM family methyltransferase